MKAGSVESSPVIVGKNLYFGSWDRHLYAYRLRGKRKPLLRWTFTADDQIVAAPAYAGRTLVHRDEQRQRLRRRRQDRTAALARDLVRALRTARVLLRDADRRLRASLHRERGRDRLRLRRVDRQPSLGARGRDVRLHGGRGLAADGVRRHLGRDLHRARRPHRRAALAVQRSVGDHRRADRPRRARLLLDVREVRRRGIATSEDRPSANLRAERAQRRPDLALPRRQVLAARRRRPPDLHHGPEQDLRAHSAGTLVEAPESEGRSRSARG